MRGCGKDEVADLDLVDVRSPVSRGLERVGDGLRGAAAVGAVAVDNKARAVKGVRAGGAVLIGLSQLVIGLLQNRRIPSPGDSLTLPASLDKRASLRLVCGVVVGVV